MHLRKVFLTGLALLMLSSLSFAAMVPGQLATQQPNTTEPKATHPSGSLDEVCTIDFQGYTYGSSSGTTTWPGGSGGYLLTGFIFSNTCLPNPLITYCVDLDHTLYTDPYCVNINEVLVRPAYADQAPAIGYVLSHYTATDAFTDRVLQLVNWKLADDQNSSHGTYGWPFYYINAGRGYPNLIDPPVFPYVNTVYNDDVALNDAANAIVRLALGADDGIAKNVVLCATESGLTADQLLIANDPPVINGGNVEVTVHVTLVRGTHSLSLGNTSLSGVLLEFSADLGTLSAVSAYTDALGQATVVLTRPIDGAHYSDSHVTVCSVGAWPKEVVPCEGNAQQQQVQAAGDLCTICVELPISGDNFLAVDLTSFSAVASNGVVVLDWRTATETNAVRWDVQRRVSGNSSFENIAIVAASNSSNGSSYHYVDATAQSGSSYDYRLVDVDINGVRTSHDFVTAFLPATNGTVISEFALENNYPNPFNPETNISFSLAETGRTLLQVSFQSRN